LAAPLGEEGQERKGEKEEGREGIEEGRGGRGGITRCFGASQVTQPAHASV